MSCHAIFWAFVAVCSWGLAPVLEKFGLARFSPATFLFLQSLIITVFVGTGLYARGMFSSASLYELSPATISLLILAAIIGGILGEYAYLQVMAESGAGRAVTLTSIYPLVTLGISVILLHEAMTMTSWLGACFVISGVMLIGSS